MHFLPLAPFLGQKAAAFTAAKIKETLYNYKQIITFKDQQNGSSSTAASVSPGEELRSDPNTLPRRVLPRGNFSHNRIFHVHVHFRPPCSMWSRCRGTHSKISGRCSAKGPAQACGSHARTTVWGLPTKASASACPSRLKFEIILERLRYRLEHEKKRYIIYLNKIQPNIATFNPLGPHRANPGANLKQAATALAPKICTCT